MLVYREHVKILRAGLDSFLTARGATHPIQAMNNTITLPSSFTALAVVCELPKPCAPGAYPWDDWRRCALAAGLSDELAWLGRSLMREADQHCWCVRLRAECGWNDAGRAMLARLLTQPRRTAARLNWLLATDGLRFDPWNHREHYDDSPCWKPLRAKWDRERAKEAGQ
jgi:hypothetical protein